MLAVRLLLLLGVPAAAEFRPHTISFQDLQRARTGHAILHEALSEVGLVAISDIPGYPELRSQVLSSAHRCLRALPDDDARGHFFEDGTERRTLAMAVGGEPALRKDLPSCNQLRAELGRFRDLVGRVSHIFASRLGELLNLGDSPLLASASGDEYETVESLFEHGDHLDHIHSYYLKPASQGSNLRTMDLHTDQGLCIAFTPALLVEEDQSGEVHSLGKAAGRFQIQLRDSAVTDIALRGDELIFMLGDGVNQYVNPKKLDGPELRAVPHALTMPEHAANQWRVWFGRMFLPPADAVSQEHGITYGQMSEMLTEAWVTEDDDFMPRLGLGCSGGQHAAELRELDEVDPPCSSGSRRRCSGSCANNQLQCWWRCMNFTDLASTCSADEHVNCTNRRDEISLGSDHGDFGLTCTSSTTMLKGNCEIEQINANRTSTCSAESFKAFLTEQAGQEGYQGEHILALDEEDNAEVVFKWKVVDSKVKGMLAFNGKASWLSVGIENMGAKKNGMQGAPVVLGISANDQEFPELMGEVNEYKIHDSESRMRHWNTPFASPALTDTEMLDENCHMAMKFTTDSIFGTALNVTSGTNRLIWALRASSYMHIGKDSYHEGCAGLERTRFRGGGTETPWTIDFNDYDSSTGVGDSVENTGGSQDTQGEGETASDGSQGLTAGLHVVLGLLLLSHA